MHQPVIGIHLEAGGFERLQRCGMAIEDGVAVDQQTVGEEIQAARGGDSRIKLADGAAGGVARIGEFGKALLLLLVVHAGERRGGNQQFAAHFERGRQACFLQMFAARC